MKSELPFRPPYVLMVLLREVADREGRTMNAILIDAVKHYIGITIENDPQAPSKILEHLRELLEMDKATIEKRIEVLDKVKETRIGEEEARRQADLKREEVFKARYRNPRQVARRRFNPAEDYSDEWEGDARHLSNVLGVTITAEECEVWVRRHAMEKPEEAPA